MDTVERVRDALQQGAGRLDLEGLGAEAVMRQAAGRARRVRAMVAVAAVTALTVVAAGAWRLSSQPSQTVVMQDGGVAGARVASEPLVAGWQEAPGVPDRLGRVVTTTDGTSFALSGPTDAGAPVTLRRSTGGGSWEAVVVPGGLLPADLAARDDRLNVLGVPSVAMADPGPQVVVSTDGGTSWAAATLPSATRPPQARVPIRREPHTAMRLAAGDRGLVALVHTGYRLDTNSLEPAATGTQSWIPTTEGMRLVEQPCPLHPMLTPEGRPADSEGCVPTIIATVPWTELGLDGVADLEVTELFVSTEGTEWHATGSPLDGRFVTDLIATADGFLALLSLPPPSAAGVPAGEPIIELWRSADGASWERLDPPHLPRPHSLGVFGDDRVFGLSEASERLVVLSEDGGATWSAVDLGPALADRAGDIALTPVAAAGPLGVAVVATVVTQGSEAPTFPYPAGGFGQLLLTSPDARRWTATAVAEIAGDAAALSSHVAVGGDFVLLTARWLDRQDQQPAHRHFVAMPPR